MLRTFLFKPEIDFRLSLESSEVIISSWVICMLSRSFAIWFVVQLSSCSLCISLLTEFPVLIVIRCYKHLTPLAFYAIRVFPASTEVAGADALRQELERRHPFLDIIL